MDLNALNKELVSRRNLLFLVVLSAIAFLGSRSYAILVVYGIDDKVGELTQQEVLKSALKLKIDASELYFMDISFAGYLNDIDTSL